MPIIPNIKSFTFGRLCEKVLDKSLKITLVCMVPFRPLTGLTIVSYSTKEFLKKVGISESTLRRWLSEDRIPELKNVKRDWKGWRMWEDEHVETVLEYKKRRSLLLKK